MTLAQIGERPRTVTRRVVWEPAREWSSPARVDLVYPPFGPAGLPSLGLSLLSAQLASRGFRTRVHYWNLDVAQDVEAGDVGLHAYRALTERTWFPFNEWAFAGVVYGSHMADRDVDTATDLFNRSLSLPDEPVDAGTIWNLRQRASGLVATMVQRLANADVVGISTTFFQNLPALALAKEVKRVWPAKLVVLGGANCDGEMGRALFEEFPFLDALFVGEADTSFPDFVSSLSEEHAVVPPDGVLFRSLWGQHDLPAGDLSSREPQPLKDLDSLPTPHFDDWISERHRTGVASRLPLVLAMESSRGCWWGAKHHCTFCGLNANGMAYRRKSLDKLVAEVRDCVQSTGARFVYMTDNILAMDYFDDLRTLGALDVPVEFFFEVKANLRRSHIKALAAAGVTAVQPGIESFSSATLALMRKGVTAAQNVEFIRNAQSLGVRPVYNLLVGFPGEDPGWYDDVVRQLPALAHLDPPATVAHVEFHRFSPYHNDPKSFGIQLRPLEAYEALYPFDLDRIAQVAYMFRRDDVQSRRPTPDYVAELGNGVAAWRAARRAGARLAYRNEGADLIVEDTRPAFGPRILRLAGYAPSVLASLQQPHTVQRLVEAAMEEADGDLHDVEFDVSALYAASARPGEIPIVFDRASFVTDAEGWLLLLTETGLVFEDRQAGPRPRYVALPLPLGHESSFSGWSATGV